MVQTIGNVPVNILDGETGRVIRWSSGMAIDADGAPTAYAPIESELPTLDYLGNAGHPGNWYGLVTDNGNPDGEPVIQGPNDLAPGHYISQTALVNGSYPVTDPRRYVDASSIPFVAVPPELRHLGVHLGDVGQARWNATGNRCAFVVADVGPPNVIGEGSVALAAALGIDPDAKRGGTEAGVEYIIFCRSTKGWPRTFDDFSDQVVQLIAALG